MSRRPLLACFGLVLAWQISGFGAEPVLFWHQNVHEAWRKAQQQQRPILLYITMDNCLYCKRMQKETLADRQIQHAIRDEYVPVTIDRKLNKSLVRKLRVKIFPTTVVIDVNGRPLGSFTGYADTAEFSKQLRDWRRTRMPSR